MLYQIQHSVFKVVQALLWPVRGVPLLTLSVVSLIAGVAFLLVYARVSNQEGLKRTKRALQASLLEAILYRHSPAISLRAQGRMFVLTFRYLSFTLPPLVVLIVPCVLLLSYLRPFVGVAPMPAGTGTLVSATTQSRGEAFDLSLNGQAHLKVSQPVREEDRNAAYWQISVPKVGKPALTDVAAKEVVELGSGADSVEIPIRRAWSDGPAADRAGRSWLDALFYPSAIKLPRNVQSITILYPDAHYQIGPFSMHWLLIFFLLSLVSGLAASKYFHIEI